MILEPLPLTPDRDIPPAVLTELTALYASDHAFQALSGDFPDPDDIRPEQVAAELADELANPHVEVELARSEGRLVGVVVTLAHHPDPADPDPWIGLLLVDAAVQGRGFGRRIAEAVEDRFRAAGRSAVRLAVLDANPRAWPSGPPSATHRSPTAATSGATAPARCCASSGPTGRHPAPTKAEAASPCRTARSSRWAPSPRRGRAAPRTP